MAVRQTGHHQGVYAHASDVQEQCGLRGDGVLLRGLRMSKDLVLRLAGVLGAKFKVQKFKVQGLGTELFAAGLLLTGYSHYDRATFHHPCRFFTR